MHVQEKLKFLRFKANYTQEYLASEIGVDYTTYGKYESGKTHIKLDQAVKIANLYNITIDELCGLENKTVKDSNSIKKHNLQLLVELDGEDKSLTDLVKRLTDMNNLI